MVGMMVAVAAPPNLKLRPTFTFVAISKNVTFFPDIDCAETYLG